MKFDENELLDSYIDTDAQRLLAIWENKSIESLNNKKIPVHPDTSISISTLFTGGRLEPQMVNELKKEILSSDRIDLLVSFIKWSGLRLIIKELEEFCVEKPLRIVTTTYMGATEVKAMMELARLPNTEIKISYDTRSSRLHAKAYIFFRNSGFSTAYIGSSNLSCVALSGGLEWNVKVTEKDLPHILKNVNATFDTYWNDQDFKIFTKDDENTLRVAIEKETRGDFVDNGYMFDIEPFPFQTEILEELEAERKIHNRFRNLIVAATGTGKTVISAFDYRRYCRANPGKPNRLLFVAHRREILLQSLTCFRGVLRDNNFGEVFDGINKPSNFDHLFISIQTFNSQEFVTKTGPDYYDFIVVDETHHSAASSYQELLTYYKPKILLGLTATPERMDGSDIREYFDNVIASEIRLPEAINRGLLVPFQYFGITDNVDLSSIKFERGKYDVNELSQVYVNNRARAVSIIDSVKKYVTEIDNVIGLGFCVTKEHARFMESMFNEAGISSMALTDESAKDERQNAKKRLASSEIKFIFSVDLYNEGVDIPEVNTVLFLRPTESLTIFLQQLGRGLRVFPGKEELTVLDFIGQANKQYSFERKFQVLIEGGYKSVADQIENGFSSLPNGCYIQLEKIAREYILDNIHNAIINKNNIINKIKTYEGKSSEKVHLTEFLNYFGLTPRDIYSRSTLSGLYKDAGIIDTDISVERNAFYAKAFLRISHIDSRRWISTIKYLLNNDVKKLDPIQEKLILMLFYNFYNKKPIEMGFPDMITVIQSFRKESVFCEELIQLLDYRYNKIKFLDEPVDIGYENALDLHCTYSREDILTGLGVNSLKHRQESREGVFYFKEQDIDIFFINLQKSEKDFSPTTMYEDYAISDRLFHWQSQSKTSDTSITGQRYITDRKSGGRVLLFVRDVKSEPYIFLGKANYESHQGSRPISIVWKLEKPMPPHILERALAAIRR
jgi:superfamily II DNA or RNA helicase